MVTGFAITSPDQTVEDRRDEKFVQFVPMNLESHRIRPSKTAAIWTSRAASCLRGVSPDQTVEDRRDWNPRPIYQAHSCLTGSDRRRPPRFGRVPVVDFAFRSQRIRPSKTAAMTAAQKKAYVIAESHRIRPSKTAAIQAEAPHERASRVSPDQTVEDRRDSRSLGRCRGHSRLTGSDRRRPPRCQHCEP